MKSIEVPAAASAEELRITRPAPNVGEFERTLSLVSGGLMAFYGADRGGAVGFLCALTGLGLAHRGVAGRCAIYDALGISTASKGEAIFVEASIRVQRSAPEIYGIFSDFTNHPSIFGHIDRAEVVDATRVRIVSPSPEGHEITWTLEPVDEVPGSAFAWRSIDGDEVEHAGYVRLIRRDDGTEIQVGLEFEPPPGPLGNRVLALFDFDAEAALQADLERFRHVVENIAPFAVAQVPLVTERGSPAHGRAKRSEQALCLGAR